VAKGYWDLCLPDRSKERAWQSAGAAFDRGLFPAALPFVRFAPILLQKSVEGFREQ
jgi:hypothetical protein